LPPSLSAAQQTLVIDDEHLQLENSDRPSPSEYLVQAGPAVVLDARNYQFRVPAELEGRSIDSVQVIVDRDRQFSAEWNPRVGLVTLSANTLRAHRVSRPFAGFEKGQRLVIAIGNAEAGHFNVVWVGIVRVA
jgi:hypothetical protein